MPATALKKKPRVVEPAPAPAVPDERLALFDAIEAKRKADRAVEAQNEAISRGRELRTKAEEDIEKLRAKIAAADQTDVKRAATLIRGEKPITSPWVGESARRSVESAEEKLALTERALGQLKQDLEVMEDDAAEAANAVIVEFKEARRSARGEAYREAATIEARADHRDQRARRNAR